MFRRCLTNVTVRAAPSVAVQSRNVKLNAYAVFMKQVYKNPQYAGLQEQLSACGNKMGKRGKILGAAWKKVSTADKQMLAQIGSKTHFKKRTGKKAKWLKQHGDDAKFKGLKGKEKLAALTKYRKKLGANKANK